WTRQFGTSQCEYALGVASGPAGILVAGLTTGVFPGQTANGGGDVFARVFDFGGTELWTHQFDSLGAGTTFARSVHARGSIYVAGDTNGALPGQTHVASTDAYLARYDTAGSLVWLREFGTVGFEYAAGVAADGSGNAFVVGDTTGTFPGQTRSGVYANAYVRKYDSAGNELWTRQFGAASGGTRDTYLLGAAADSSGAVFVAGYVLGALAGQVWQGQWDLFVRKYDAAGNEVWTRQLGTPSNDYATAVAVDPAGGALVAGYTDGTFPSQSKSGAPDAVVLKFDAAGSLIWTSQFGVPGGSAPTRLQAVAAAADGSALVAGHTGGTLPGQTPAGSVDAFVRKLSPSGAEVWTRQFGGTSYEYAWAVGVDPSGNVAVFGQTHGVLPGQTPAGGVTDVFLRRYDPNGADLGLMQFGTSANDWPGGVSIDNDGSIYLAGWTMGVFAGQTRSGAQDAVLLKLSTNAPPAVTVGQASVLVPEGSVAGNSGTFSDPNTGDNVTISASFGAISKSGTNAGTWSWSWNAVDGPAPAQTVTITANDGKGGVATVSFTVAVANVAPTVAFSVTPTLSENQTA
ncbi:MAG: SBBP repeat-containing protein, partial [Acidobacteriota bacterium]